MSAAWREAKAIPTVKDEKKPWAVVIKIDDDEEDEKKPGSRTVAHWRDAGRVSTFAPIKDEERRREPMVVPVHKDGAKPWDETRAKPETMRPLPKPAETKQEPAVVIMLPPTSEDGAWRERVCAKNYAAVDAETGAYGLIGSGEVAEPGGGVRSLVMHVPRRVQHRAGGAHRVLTQVRPGSILRVQKAANKRARDDEPAPPVRELRVRFTTPARYYGPGSNVTTLAIGVDEADWQDVLVPDGV